MEALPYQYYYIAHGQTGGMLEGFLLDVIIEEQGGSRLPFNLLDETPLFPSLISSFLLCRV